MTGGSVLVHLPPALLHAARWQVSAGGHCRDGAAGLPVAEGTHDVCVSGTGFLFGCAFRLELTVPVTVHDGRTTTIRLPLPVMPS